MSLATRPQTRSTESGPDRPPSRTAEPTGRGAGPVAPVVATELRPLPAHAVTLTGGLLGAAQRTNATTSIPHGHDHLEAAQAWTNFDNTAARSTAGSRPGDPVPTEYHGPFYEDGEAYKWLEAVAWQAGHQDSPQLRDWLSSFTRRVAAAQADDGYLNTFIQLGQAGDRYEALDHFHEIFNMGALIQSAVAQYRAVGSTELLDVALRVADHLDATFGPGPDQRAGTDGHPVVEMALVELYRLTGVRRYLDLARYFVEVRGHGVLRREWDKSVYLSDRIPVRETTTPEGHAVRAVYLAAGATDVAIETDDQELLQQLELQWRNMVDTKTYVTGGLGSRWEGEAFGDPYELPASSAYAETCASVAAVQWSWRLLLATGDVTYADHIERQLYNTVLAGIGLDGNSYFYANALQVREGSPDTQERSPSGGRRRWFGTSCCPTNAQRTLASLQAYVATSTDRGVQVHQLTRSTIEVDGAAGPVALTMDTDYPWDGTVTLTVDEAPADPWELRVRVPSWVTGPTAALNGEPVPVASGRYLTLDRAWRSGDQVVLTLPMTPRLVRAHHRVADSNDSVAIERGPLVYALEQVDQEPGVVVDDLQILPDASLGDEWRDDVLGGLPLVTASGVVVKETGALRLAAEPPEARAVTLRAVPYFRWANRELGPMKVWIPVWRGPGEQRGPA